MTVTAAFAPSLDITTSSSPFAAATAYAISIFFAALAGAFGLDVSHPAAGGRRQMPCQRAWLLQPPPRGGGHHLAFPPPLVPASAQRASRVNACLCSRRRLGPTGWCSRASPRLAHVSHLRRAHEHAQVSKQATSKIHLPVAARGLDGPARFCRTRCDLPRWSRQARITAQPNKKAAAGRPAKRAGRKTQSSHLEGKPC